MIALHHYWLCKKTQKQLHVCVYMCEIDVLMCDFSGVCILRKLLLKIMLAVLKYEAVLFIINLKI